MSIINKINSNGIQSDPVALEDRTREYGVIQNCGTNPLFVKFGSGCTTGNFDIILKACSVNDDGTGGLVEFGEDGIVTVASSSLRYTAFER